LATPQIADPAWTGFVNAAQHNLTACPVQRLFTE